MALFPNHQVQLLEALPEVAPIDFDAMIVDAAALREQDSLADSDLKTLQNWKVPLLLIEPDGGEKMIDRAHLVRLRRPVVKEKLQKALTDCLAGASVTNTNPAERVDPGAKPKSKSKKQKAAVRVASAINYIELVDVVEEGVATSAHVIQAQKKI